jgi:hypothetical protein
LCSNPSQKNLKVFQSNTFKFFWSGLIRYSNNKVCFLIPKHKEEATDDIREKGERG